MGSLLGPTIADVASVGAIAVRGEFASTLGGGRTSRLEERREDWRPPIASQLQALSCWRLLDGNNDADMSLKILGRPSLDGCFSHGQRQPAPMAGDATRHAIRNLDLATAGVCHGARAKNWLMTCGCRVPTT